MSWLEKVRQKPHHEKVRLVWIIVIICAILLIIIWILTSRLPRNSQADTSLFQTFGQGIRNLREQFSANK